MTLDINTLGPALKNRYVPMEVRTLSYTDHPFMAMVEKDETFFGIGLLPIPIRFATNAARSVDYATGFGMQGATSSQYRAFHINRARDYAFARMNNETLKASSNDIGSFVKGLTSEIDGSFQSIGRSAATKLYRTGTGSVGTVGAYTGGPATFFTLANIGDVVNYEVGETLVASAVGLGDGGLLYAGSTVITAIDRDLGIITGSGNLAAQFVGFGVGDFIYKQGDAANGGPLIAISGLAGWLPAVAPGALDNWFGVNRSVDSTRLAGIRYDGSAETVEEALIGASVRAGLNGAKCDYAFLNPVNYGQLLRTLGAKVNYATISSPGGVAPISFEGVKLHTAYGTITVLPDADCPVGRGYMLTMSTWKIYSLGMMPQMLQDEHSQGLIRAFGQDAWEVQIGYYSQLACEAPGYNVTMQLAV
jgi:hypothetical protein